MLRLIRLSLGIVMLLPLCAAAQSPRVVPEVGERVRIRAPRFAEGVIFGRLLRVEADTIVVSLATDTARHLGVPRDKIIGVQVQRGLKRNWLIGGIIGGVIGGGVMALAAGDDPEFLDLRTLVIVAGAGGGVLVGVAIGALTKSDRWQVAQFEAPRTAQIGRFTPGVRLVLRF